MCQWKRLPVHKLWRRTAFLVVAFLVSSTLTAYAAGTVADAVTTAERIEKMGATGVLALVSLLLGAAIIYMMRLHYGKIQEVIDRNTRVNERTAILLERLERELGRRQ